MWQNLPGLPSPLLHTVTDQKLEPGMTWEWAYSWLVGFKGRILMPSFIPPKWSPVVGKLLKTCACMLHMIPTVAEKGYSILPISAFPSLMFPIWAFPIWLFPIWLFPIWPFPIWLFPIWLFPIWPFPIWTFPICHFSFPINLDMVRTARRKEWEACCPLKLSSSFIDWLKKLIYETLKCCNR